MVYVTAVRTIEKTVKYWVPDNIIKKAHKNCGDSAYAYLAKLNKPEPSYNWPANCGYWKVVSEEIIDEKIVDPDFPKTIVNPSK